MSGPSYMPNTNIENATIRSNQGYGLELTDWGQEDYYSDWIKVQSPSVSISKSNFIDNYKTRTLDDYRYDNIWEDWDGVQYTGDGWVDNWEEKIYREVPFGTIAWIGFKYNSNNGGSEFLLYFLNADLIFLSSLSCYSKTQFSSLHNHF